MSGIKPDTSCPLNNFKKCKGVDCSWYIQIRGVDPNTGMDVDDWGCAVTWLPMLMIENSQQQRQTGAAVESFRNEMVKGQSATIEALIHSQGPKALVQ